MSYKVKQRLAELGIETTHEERVALDNVIEERTSQYCDAAVGKLTVAEFKSMVAEAKRRAKKKQHEDEAVASGAAEQAERLLTEGIA